MDEETVGVSLNKEWIVSLTIWKRFANKNGGRLAQKTVEGWLRKRKKVGIENCRQLAQKTVEDWLRKL